MSHSDDSDRFVVTANVGKKKKYKAIIRAGKKQVAVQEDVAASFDKFFENLGGCASLEETKSFYDMVAFSYEEDMTTLGYTAPTKLAAYIHDKCKIPVSVKILDIGCGTGLLGGTLYAKGYRNLHGLDMSDGMMNLCENKPFYKNLVVSAIDATDSYQVEEKYDVICMCGSFLPGHVLPDALPKLAQGLNSQGRIIWISRKLSNEKRKGTPFQLPKYKATIDSFLSKYSMRRIEEVSVDSYQTNEQGEIVHLQKTN